MTPHVFVSVLLNPDEQEPHTEVIRYDQFVRRLFKGGPEKEELLHWALGLIGEVVELLEATEEDHKVEELGDIGFYFWRGADHFDIDLLNMPSDTNYGNLIINNLLITTGNLVDKIKKIAIYNKPIAKEELSNSFNEVYNWWIEYIKVYTNKVPQQILQANAEKLAKRYVGLTYSDLAAQIRADKPDGE